MFSISWYALAAGCALDFFIGDPHRLPHPIRWIGRLIALLEKRIRPLFPKSSGGQMAAGTFMAVCVLLVTGGACTAVRFAAWRAGLLAPADAVMVFYLLAARSLKTESMKVCTALESGDIEGARRAVSMIVGRDTERLMEDGIARAAVETVAENASDGAIAPLFYIFLGGPVLGFLYKAVNTMDSMVGYKNDAYLYFGRFAARLDDILNLLPSRLSALFMTAAAFLSGMDGRGAFRIFLRDRYNHKSPNSAQTEAACAGALGVRLAGPAWYFGVLNEKPYIGDDLRPVEPGDIRRANRLLFVSFGLAFAVFSAVRWCALAVL